MKYSLLLLAGVLCTSHLFSMKRRTPSDLENCITRVTPKLVAEAACNLIDQNGKRFKHAYKLMGETQQGQFLVYKLGIDKVHIDLPMHINLQIFKMLSGSDANKVFAKSYTMNFQEDSTGQYEKIANYIEELISAKSE